ncbi:MAG: hypothetical protein EOM83_08735 [Clostridia bacterium]|nr:hypothetical protein [Clostridia bacterium]
MNKNSISAFCQKQCTERNFFWALFIVSWAYVWLRAASTQLIYDETSTFFRYVYISEILPYSSDLSANNHVLNTILSYASYSLFGANSLVFRLPNVLSYVLFFYFLVRLGSYIRHRVLRVSLVVMLVFTHNFIEFFALSRGYGLSIGLLMPALWYLSKALDQAKVKDYLLALLFAALALSANLTLINTVIIFISLLSLKLLVDNKMTLAKAWQHWVIILIVGVGSVIYFAVFIFTLKAAGELYYGDSTGFWTVTVNTLIETLFGKENLLVGIFVGFYFVWMALAGGWFFIRKISIQKLFNPRLLLFYFLVGNILAAILLKHFFGINYPQDRTGLYFVVFFVGSLFFITDLAVEQFRTKAPLFILIPLLFIPVHFLMSMNLSYNAIEPHKIPDRFYDKIFESYVPGEAPPTVGGYRIRELRWAYLNFSHGGLLGKLHWTFYPSRIEDFQIVDTSYFKDWRTTYDSIDYEPTSGFYLLKRKSAIPQQFIDQKNNIAFEAPSDIEYYSLFKVNVDTLQGETVEVVFDIYFNTAARPFRSWLVASVADAQAHEIRYEYLPLDWLHKNREGESGHLINNMIVPIPDGAATLNIYIWNLDKVTFDMHDGMVRIMKYEK